MGALRAVFTSTLRTTLRSVPLVALYLAIALLATTLTVVLTGTLALLPAAVASPQVAAFILGASACICAMVCGGLVFTVLLGSPLTRDQATGRITALAASPAGAKIAWAGRSLALGLIASIFAVLCGIAAVVTMRAIWAPHVPIGDIDGWFIFGLVVIIPITLMGMAFFTAGVGLSAGAVHGSVAANIVYIGATITTGRSAGAGLMPGGYVAVIGAIGIALLIAAAITSRYVTRERLVLACQ